MWDDWFYYQDPVQSWVAARLVKRHASAKAAATTENNKKRAPALLSSLARTARWDPKFDGLTPAAAALLASPSSTASHSSTTSKEGTPDSSNNDTEEPGVGACVELRTVLGQRILLTEAQFAALRRAEPSSINRDLPNLVALEEFTAGAVLHQLRQRYLRGDIYTNIGDIVISINPYRLLPLFTPRVMERYLSSPTTTSASPLAPHIFQIALRAYRAAIAQPDLQQQQEQEQQRQQRQQQQYAHVHGGRDQSIIISGESGSGKTEAAKLILNFFSEASTYELRRRRFRMQKEEEVEDTAPMGGDSNDGANVSASMEASTAPATPSTSSPQRRRSLLMRQRLERFDQLLLRANMVLEAFGNAKTTRNHNSSRFGKLLDVWLSAGSGQVTGGRIVNYLLQKARVTAHSAGERNFHVFYQTLLGVDSDLRRRWRLGHPLDFRYLNPKLTHAVLDEIARTQATPVREPALSAQKAAKKNPFDTDSDEEANLESLTSFYSLDVAANSDTATADAGVNDADHFESTLLSLKALGFSRDEVHGILRSLAGVLHLGQLVVTERSSDEAGAGQMEACTLSATSWARAQLEVCAEVLGAEAGPLEAQLTHRKVDIRGETWQRPLSVVEARSNIDALAKAIYARLFDWVVARINRALALHDVTDETVSSASAGAATAAAAAAATADTRRHVMLLDIYGFEVFEENRFEQLLINYANEHLQQLFVWRVFELELHEYRREGVNVGDTVPRDVARFDNRDVIALLGGPSALLPRPSLLHAGGDTAADHDLGVAGSTVLSLLNVQAKTPGGCDDRFVQELKNTLCGHPRFFSDRRRPEECFIVRHFAADVTYTATGAVHKNKDRLESALSHAMASVKSPLLAALFRDDARLGPDAMAKKRTVAECFHEQLKQLTSELAKTDLHFVRCIKPNRAKKKLVFDSPLVLEQFRYSGLFEAIELRKKGFPFRKTHAAFRQRYAVLVSPALPESVRARVHARVDGLLLRFLTDGDGVTATSAADTAATDGEVHAKLGRTKVLMSAEMFSRLEALRASARTHFACRIQRTLRVAIAKRKLKRRRARVARIEEAIIHVASVDAPRDKAQALRRLKQLIVRADYDGFEHGSVVRAHQLVAAARRQQSVLRSLSDAMLGGDHARLLALLAQVDTPEALDSDERLLLAQVTKVAADFARIRRVRRELDDAVMREDATALRQCLSETRSLLQCVALEDGSDLDTLIGDEPRVDEDPVDLSFWQSTPQWQQLQRLFSKACNLLRKLQQFSVAIAQIQGQMEELQRTRNRQQTRLLLRNDETHMLPAEDAEENSVDDVLTLVSDVNRALLLRSWTTHVRLLVSLAVSLAENYSPREQEFGFATDQHVSIAHKARQVWLRQAVSVCEFVRSIRALSNAPMASLEDSAAASLLMRQLGQLMPSLAPSEAAVDSLLSSPNDSEARRVMLRRLAETRLQFEEDLMRLLRKFLPSIEVYFSTFLSEARQKQEDEVKLQKFYAEFKEAVVLDELPPPAPNAPLPVPPNCSMSDEEESLSNAIEYDDASDIDMEEHSAPARMPARMTGERRHRRLQSAARPRKLRERRHLRQSTSGVPMLGLTDLVPPAASIDMTELSEKEALSRETGLIGGVSDGVAANATDTVVATVDDVADTDRATDDTDGDGATPRDHAPPGLAEAIAARDLKAVERIMRSVRRARRSSDGVDQYKNSRLVKIGDALLQQLRAEHVVLLELRRAVTELDRPEIVHWLERAAEMGLDADLNSGSTCEASESSGSGSSKRRKKRRQKGTSPAPSPKAQASDVKLLRLARKLAYGMSASEFHDRRIEAVLKDEDLESLELLLTKAHLKSWESPTVERARQRLYEKRMAQQQSAVPLAAVCLSEDLGTGGSLGSIGNSLSSIDLGPTRRLSACSSATSSLGSDTNAFGGSLSVLGTESDAGKSSADPRWHRSSAPYVDASTIRRWNFSSLFASFKGRYPLARCPMLRRPGDYARRSYGHRKGLKRMMHRWQNEPIPRSLVKFPRDTPNKVKKLAPHIFKNILALMGDRVHAYPATLAHEVVSLGMSEPALRNEIFMQLIKQTTNNPSAQSCVRGWKVLYLCLGAFTPSAQVFGPCLLSHLAVFADPRPRQLCSFDTLKEAAASCFLQWQLTKQIPAADRRVPSMRDISRVLEMRCMTNATSALSTLMSELNDDDGGDSQVSRWKRRQRPQRLRHSPSSETPLPQWFDSVPVRTLGSVNEFDLKRFSRMSTAQEQDAFKSQQLKMRDMERQQQLEQDRADHREFVREMVARKYRLFVQSDDKDRETDAERGDVAEEQQQLLLHSRKKRGHKRHKSNVDAVAALREEHFRQAPTHQAFFASLESQLHRKARDRLRKQQPSLQRSLGKARRAARKSTETHRELGSRIAFYREQMRLEEEQQQQQQQQQPQQQQQEEHQHGGEKQQQHQLRQKQQKQQQKLPRPEEPLHSRGRDAQQDGTTDEKQAMSILLKMKRDREEAGDAATPSPRVHASGSFSFWQRQRHLRPQSLPHSRAAFDPTPLWSARLDCADPLRDSAVEWSRDSAHVAIASLDTISVHTREGLSVAAFELGSLPAVRETAESRVTLSWQCGHPTVCVARCGDSSVAIVDVELRKLEHVLPPQPPSKRRRHAFRSLRGIPEMDDANSHARAHSDESHGCTDDASVQTAKFAPSRAQLLLTGSPFGLASWSPITRRLHQSGVRWKGDVLSAVWCPSPTAPVSPGGNMSSPTSVEACVALTTATSNRLIRMCTATGRVLDHATLSSEADMIKASSHGTLAVAHAHRKSLALVFRCQAQHPPVELAFRPEYGEIVSFAWLRAKLLGLLLVAFARGSVVVISTQPDARLGLELQCYNLHERLWEMTYSPAANCFCALGDRGVRVVCLTTDRDGPVNRHFVEVDKNSNTLCVDDEEHPCHAKWSNDGTVLTVIGNQGTVHNFAGLKTASPLSPRD